MLDLKKFFEKLSRETVPFLPLAAMVIITGCQQAFWIETQGGRRGGGSSVVAPEPVELASPAPETEPTSEPTESSQDAGQDSAQDSHEPMDEPTPGFTIEPGLEPSPLPSPEPSPEPSPVPVPSPSTSPVPVVCDPLDGSAGGKQAGARHGIHGKVYTLEPSQPRFVTSEDYIRHGHEVALDVFMKQLNVRPRHFREGFRPNGQEGGEALRSEQGGKILEHFGLDLRTEIRLAPGDQPGRYQLAILSDDGATLRVIEPGRSGLDGETLVSFEGAHAPGLGCANRAIEFDSSTRLPIRLSYFQGPRYQLALMLLWRRIDQDSPRALSDRYCGRYDNDLFFKVRPNASAVPQKAYQQLLKRGWKPLAPENFHLAEGKNRCQ